MVKDYVVLSGLVSNLNRVAWSGINDATFWTYGTSGSDYQDFPDGGEVMGVSGLESSICIQKDAVRLMTFTGDNFIFRFDRIQGARGCFAPYSMVNVAETTFYYGLDGFYAASGTQSVPIGVGSVNNWFRDNASAASISQMVGVADPRSTRVFWMFKSVDAGADTFDMIIGYDWARKLWFKLEQTLEFVCGAATLGYTLEDLDALFPSGIDAMTVSLDSSIWEGGVPALAGFSSNHKLGFFDGANAEAILTIAEAQLAPPGCTPTSPASPRSSTPPRSSWRSAAATRSRP